MKNKTKKQKQPADPDATKRHEHEAAGAAAGALAGAAMGAIAGPPGAIAGAVIGAIAGAATEMALENDAEWKAVENRALDADIGVSGGEMGAPNLKHPPAKVGAYSGAASGGSSGSAGEEPAEGPIQTPES